MKRRWRITAIIAAAVIIVLAVTGVVLAQGSWSHETQGTSAGRGAGNGAGRLTTTTSAPATPAAPADEHLPAVSDTALSQTEKDSLVFLREEEKLARDVYAALSAKWGTNVFNNISASEARHMASVKTLLDRYGLADPVATDTAGVFVNAELQAAYNDLVAKGSASLQDAFQVGVTIENLDIEDLQALLAASTHADITQVAQNLLKGSQNHLASFTRRLAA